MPLTLSNLLSTITVWAEESADIIRRNGAVHALANAGQKMDQGLGREAKKPGQEEWKTNRQLYPRMGGVWQAALPVARPRGHEVLRRCDGKSQRSRTQQFHPRRTAEAHHL